MEAQEREIAIDEEIVVDGLKNPTYLVIVGFGSKRLLDACYKSHKDIQNVLIIEPDLGVFKQTLKRDWIGDLARNARMDLLVGIPPEQMLPHIHKIFTVQDPRFGSRAARCFGPEVIVDPFVYPATNGQQHPVAQQIINIIQETSRQVQLSMGCGTDTFIRWEQMIRNADTMANAYRITPQYGRFTDVPVIVLGAGPSMSDFIDAYWEYKLGEKALIIACDAALGKLMKHGIKPHIVTRCERKLTTIFKGVERKDTKGVYYAAYPWTSKEFFDLFEDKFMIFRDNGVCKWTGYDHGSVNGGVSSANAALELAFMLGAKNIVMSGIDLCFINDKSHVEGTEVEFDIEKSRDKWSKIPGNSGEVTSIPVWVRCLNEYRATLSKYHDVGATVWNTSIAGASIFGTKVSPWTELGPRFAVDFDCKLDIAKRIASRLEKCPPGYEMTFNQKRKDTVKVLSDCLADLKKLQANIDDALMIAKREEDKVVLQLESYRGHDYFSACNEGRKGLIKVYKEPARQIDNFKTKWYSNETISQIVLDTVQIDYFTLENKMAGLKNLYDVDHERLRVYVGSNMTFLKNVEYYLGEFIHLLENGPRTDEVKYASCDVINMD